MDDLTGLPEVRDNEHWRVAHPLKYIEGWGYSAGRSDTTKLVIRLIRTEQKPEVVSESIGWFRRKKTVVTPGGIDEKNLYTEHVQGSHPIAILNAANRILKRRTVDEARSALVGDYPPKRLHITDAV